MHSSLIWKHTQNSLSPRMCSTFESELLVQNNIVGVCSLQFSTGNMTRQLDLASFMLQADCGYCSYYRPQNESTTHKWLCSRNYISSLLLSALLSYRLLIIIIFFLLHPFHSSNHCRLCFSAMLPPSNLLGSPSSHLYRSLSLTRATSFIQLLECTLRCTHKHTHRHTSSLTHLSVICMG